MGSRRGELPHDVGQFGPYIDSFELALLVAERSPRTREMYVDAARWLAAWLTRQQRCGSWDEVGKNDLVAFFAHMHEAGYQQSYRNNIGRCLQAFFKWFSEEEDLPSPYEKFRPPPPPKGGPQPRKLIDLDNLRALIQDAEKGRDFEPRRDAAMLRIFATTGCRLAEITGLDVVDVDVKARTAIVTGKGGKTRTVRFDARTALAIDRYLRVRAKHRAHALPALWIGTRRTVRMTTSGVRQVIERRARRLGLKLTAHMFRYTFTHHYLDQGGAEGDLMELNGWESVQMLRHYGRQARSARAQRAYDRVNAMGDL